MIGVTVGQLRQYMRETDLLEHGLPLKALVAELNGRVVGAMTTHVIPAIHVTPRVAMLTVLVVADELRGRGIGRELVEHAEKFAQSHGATKIFEPMDMPYEDRQGGVTDPFGNIWWISTRLVQEPYD